MGTGFNLAIEILVISGHRYIYVNVSDAILFQSRNRDSCHFRFVEIGFTPAKVMFQSRNRDSCHFRISGAYRPKLSISSFNLAIEILVISGKKGTCRVAVPYWFQSRNRDSCHFRCNAVVSPCTSIILRFNLAIEILVISGSSVQHVRNRSVCFNLAIEILVISGMKCLVCAAPLNPGFQSRNRDSCHFRSLPAEPLIRFV